MMCLGATGSAQIGLGHTWMCDTTGSMSRIMPAEAIRAFPYFVYILRCADGTLYTGSTKDLTAREHAHNEGRGAKYTAGRTPVKIVYSESCESRSHAMKREAQIKGWTRQRKAALVAGDAGRHHALVTRQQ